MKNVRVFSCGGGRQSSAIVALMVRGEIAPPDIAVMVDTEREKSSTWRYAESTLIPALAGISVPLQIVKKSDYATVDLYRGNDLLLPVFTRQSGKLSKMPTFCSNEWKQRVVRRYLRERGVESCTMLLGMSLDEVHRMRTSDVQWITNEYPLIDLWVRKTDCYRIVREMGWPEPPRSACWMCSNQSNDEWREMRDNSPADFAKAVQMDYETRRLDPHVYLHHSGVPLDQADLTIEATGNHGECASGLCFV